jgi:restriction system protein
MSIPDFQTLMLPVLKLSRDAEVKISDAIVTLADQFGLTPEEQAEMLPSGRQAKFTNRVHWAKAYLAKAGLLDQTRRAHFKASAQGLAVLKSPPDKIDIPFLMQFQAFQAFRSRSSDTSLSPQEKQEVDSSTNLTPDERMRAAHAEISGALEDDLLTRIRQGSPAFFERIVVRLLIAMGYGGSADEVDENLAIVGGAGDGGVDGVIDQDPLGLDRVYVQAKRYAADNLVGPHAIRDFFGSLAGFRATKGLFVTTSGFTAAARQTAEGLPQKIVLVDGKQLARLLVRYEVGCRVQETLQIKRIDEDFFDD